MLFRAVVLRVKIPTSGLFPGTDNGTDIYVARFRTPPDWQRLCRVLLLESVALDNKWVPYHQTVHLFVHTCKNEFCICICIWCALQLLVPIVVAAQPMFCIKHCTVTAGWWGIKHSAWFIDCLSRYLKFNHRHGRVEHSHEGNKYVITSWISFATSWPCFIINKFLKCWHWLHSQWICVTVCMYITLILSHLWSTRINSNLALF